MICANHIPVRVLIDCLPDHPELILGPVSASLSIDDKGVCRLVIEEAGTEPHGWVYHLARVERALARGVQRHHMNKLKLIPKQLEEDEE